MFKFNLDAICIVVKRLPCIRILAMVILISTLQFYYYCSMHWRKLRFGGKWWGHTTMLLLVENFWVISLLACFFRQHCSLWDCAFRKNSNLILIPKKRYFFAKEQDSELLFPLVSEVFTFWFMQLAWHTCCAGCLISVIFLAKSTIRVSWCGWFWAL